MQQHSELGWLRSILDTAADGILVESGERVVYANAAYAKLLGYRRSTDLVYIPIADLVADGDSQRLLRFSRMRVEGRTAPISYDFVALRRDRTTIRLQASVSVAVFLSKLYILTIVRPFSATDGAIENQLIAGPHDGLSQREREVLDKILAGKRPKEIACDFGVSEKTVATHRTRLLAKLGVADNRELFQYALRHGLIHWS